MKQQGKVPYWGDPMKDVWPAGHWKVHGDKGATRLGDLIGVIPDSLFGIRDSVLEQFLDAFGMFGEALPIEIASREAPSAHLFNTLQKVPALDHERSILTGHTRQRHYVWANNVLEAGWLFRDEKRGVQVFCASDGVNGLPEFCAEHGLHGLSFRELGTCVSA
jgi:hypothetical protein